MSQTIQFVVDVEIDRDDIDVSDVDITHLELSLDDDTVTSEYSWASRRVE